MACGDKRCTGIGRALNCTGNVQPGFINGNRNSFHTDGICEYRGLWPARIFYPHFLTGVDEDAHQEVKGLGGARRYKHLLFRYLDAARAVDKTADRLPQGDVAAWVYWRR